jgi:hypothetical protein
MIESQLGTDKVAFNNAAICSVDAWNFEQMKRIIVRLHERIDGLALSIARAVRLQSAA